MSCLKRIRIAVTNTHSCPFNSNRRKYFIFHWKKQIHIFLSKIFLLHPLRNLLPGLRQGTISHFFEIKLPNLSKIKVDLNKQNNRHSCCLDAIDSVLLLWLQFFNLCRDHHLLASTNYHELFFQFFLLLETWPISAVGFFFFLCLVFDFDDIRINLSAGHICLQMIAVVTFLRCNLP